MTNLVVSVFFRFVIRFYCALNTQQGGYVHITSLIINIIIIIIQEFVIIIIIYLPTSSSHVVPV